LADPPVSVPRVTITTAVAAGRASGIQRVHAGRDISTRATARIAAVAAASAVNKAEVDQAGAG
jgi:hypothetical protein